MKNKIPIKEGLEINNYRDYLEHKQECFNIISDTLDLILEETAKKNPFLFSKNLMLVKEFLNYD